VIAKKLAALRVPLERQLEDIRKSCASESVRTGALVSPEGGGPVCVSFEDGLTILDLVVLAEAAEEVEECERAYLEPLNWAENERAWLRSHTRMIEAIAALKKGTS